MKNLIFFLLASCSVMLFGCKGEPKAAEEGTTPEATASAGDIDYDEMATGFCDCMKPMFDFQKKLMGLLEANDQEGVEALRDEAMQVQKDGEACILDLEKKFGVIEGPEQEEKATKALEKTCPEIMQLMGLAGGMEE